LRYCSLTQGAIVLTAIAPALVYLRAIGALAIMKRFAVCLLFCALGCLAKPSSDPSAHLLKEIQGEWSFVEVNNEGKALPSKKLQGLVLKIADNTWKVWASGKPNSDCTFSLDGSKKPAEIDLTIASGKDKGDKEFGIFLFEEQMLKVCISGAGGSRPTQFVIEPGAKQMILVLKRK